MHEHCNLSVDYDIMLRWREKEVLLPAEEDKLSSEKHPAGKRREDSFTVDFL